MTDKQTDALRLADTLERPGYGWHSTPAQCAAELRRLHAENDALRTGYEAARLEIASLQAQLEALASQAQPVGAVPVAPIAHVRTSRNAFTPCKLELCKADDVGAVAVFTHSAPTAQPAPQQEPSCTSVQLAEMVLSDCGHSSNYTPLLERVAARIDAHVERCLESKKTPQQEAQEPVARLEIGKTKGGVSLTHIAEPAAFQLPEGMYALYTEPQPSPAAQGDALDAARYRFLRDGEWRDTDLEPFIRLQLNTLWDAKIDAARAAQGGK